METLRGRLRAGNALPETGAATRLRGPMRWFRGRSTAIKLAVAVSLLLVLVLLSPIIFRLGEVLILVAAVVMAFRAFKRKPWRSWAVVAVAAIPPLLVCGIVSNLVYNTAFVYGIGYELSEDEREYVENVTYIEDEMMRLDAEQYGLVDDYPSTSTAFEFSPNYVIFAGRWNEAKEMKVPPGCDDHHTVWLEGLDNLVVAFDSVNKFLWTGNEEDLRYVDIFDNDARENLGEAETMLDRIERQGC